VRPSGSARKLADNEEIEIRLYSIIYDAINDVKAAMEGMLEKEMEEVIVGQCRSTGSIQDHEKWELWPAPWSRKAYVKRNNPITVDPRWYRSVFRGNDGPQTIQGGCFRSESRLRLRNQHQKLQRTSR